jgi:hypothetical protein
MATSALLSGCSSSAIAKVREISQGRDHWERRRQDDDEEAVPKRSQIRVVLLLAGSLGVSMSGAAGASAPRKLRITQVYTTAETTTSATVVSNTSVASDSVLQYSTSNPIPASAPTLPSASQVTYHDIPLTELTPGVLYYFKVTSCAKRECTTAYGSFETYPSCPDTVPSVSGNWQKAFSPNVSGTAWVTNELLGVAAVSKNDVWAVGWAQDPDGPPYVKRTLIQHFDGAAWSIVPSPNWPNDTHSQLHAVAAASAHDVWAVGTTHDGAFPARTGPLFPVPPHQDQAIAFRHSGQDALHAVAQSRATNLLVWAWRLRDRLPLNGVHFSEGFR